MAVVVCNVCLFQVHQCIPEEFYSQKMSKGFQYCAHSKLQEPLFFDEKFRSQLLLKLFQIGRPGVREPIRLCLHVFGYSWLSAKPAVVASQSAQIGAIHLPLQEAGHFTCDWATAHHNLGNCDRLVRFWKACDAEPNHGNHQAFVSFGAVPPPGKLKRTSVANRRTVLDCGVREFSERGFSCGLDSPKPNTPGSKLWEVPRTGFLGNSVCHFCLAPDLFSGHWRSCDSRWKDRDHSIQTTGLRWSKPSISIWRKPMQYMQLIGWCVNCWSPSCLQVFLADACMHRWISNSRDIGAKETLLQ